MRFQRIAIIYTAVATGLAVLAPAHAETSQEATFLAENQAAMDKMMAQMDIKPTGDVDHDFTAMMIPHHQGAIDMAQAELRYGHNEQLRRIAQEIIVEQQQEIAAMHLALGQPLPPSTAAPDQPSNLSMPMTNMQRSPK
jgi:predicted methyltransferase